MDGDPAKLPPNYVSFAQLKEQWLQKQQLEKDEAREKPKETESGLSENRERREKETTEKPKEEKKERNSGPNEILQQRLPPDYVSLAQLQERWLQKKKSSGPLKSDERAAYEDKGKCKEMPIEVKKKITSDEAGKGIEVDKEELELEIETDNGGMKGVLSVGNSGDGELKGEAGNRKDFNCGGSGYSSKRGNNEGGRFNQLKGTRVHQSENQNWYNRNWIEKRRNGNIGGDKEGSYRLKETELEKKSDNEISKICSEMGVRRAGKNNSDDNVVEREGLDGKKVEEEMILVVESVKIGENVCNKNGSRGFGNRSNAKNRGAQEGSYRSNELGLEKRSDNEKSVACSEISDGKNDSDDHVVGKEGLNGKKAEDKMNLAVERVKIGGDGCNNYERRRFGNRINENNRGAREGTYRSKELGLEKKSDNEKSAVCREVGVRSDRKNSSDDDIVEREWLNGKEVNTKMVLAVENLKISEKGYDNSGRGRFRNKRNDKKCGAQEGTYRSKEMELEKRLDNEKSVVCSEIDVRDGKNDGDDHVVEKEGLNGKKSEDKMNLAVESVKIGENGRNNNGRKTFRNQRNDNSHVAQEGSYRSKEGLEKKSDNEKSAVCRGVDVRSNRKNGSDDDTVGREGLNGKKVNTKMVLAVENLKINEKGYDNNTKTGFGNRRIDSIRGAREGSYSSKELWLEKKLDNEKSEVCSVRSRINDVSSDGNNVSDDRIAERKGLNDNVSEKAEEEMVLSVETVRICENGYKRHGSNKGSKDIGHRRYIWPRKFEERRETKEREVCSMVWVKKDDKPGR